MNWPTAGGVAAGCAVLGISGKALMVAVKAAQNWVEVTIENAILKSMGAVKQDLKVELNGRYPKTEEVDRHFRKIESHLRQQDETLRMISVNCPKC